MTTPNVSPVSVEQLLPCAHCGGSDLTGPIFNEYFGGASRPHFWVECRDCPAYMEIYTDERAVIVSAWNLRASTELKIPDGYKLVPLGPTEEILKPGSKEFIAAARSALWYELPPKEAGLVDHIADSNEKDES